MNAIGLSRYTQAILVLLELLGLSGMWVSGDFLELLFLIPIGALAIRVLTANRIGSVMPRWILPLLILGVGLTGAYFGYRNSTHPLLIAGHTALGLHGALLLFSVTRREQSLRFALSFIEILLSASTQVELSLLLTILGYALASTVYLTLVHHEGELFRLEPHKTFHPLPKGMINSYLKTGLLVFLMATLLFPLLPRIQGGFSLGPTRSGSGFGALGGGIREGDGPETLTKLSFRDWIDLSRGGVRFDPQARSEVALRLFWDPEVEFPWKRPLLLKGQVLSRFTGDAWKASVRDNDPPPPPFESSSHTPNGPRYEFLNETSLGTKIFYPPSSRLLEYTPSTYGKTRYLFESIPREAPSTEGKPHQSQLELPEKWREFFRNHLDWSKIALRVPSQEPQALFQAAIHFLRDSGRYTADSQNGAKSLGAFLSREEPRGHCEWFATALALYLRSQGVPTRVIAGFRVDRPLHTGAHVVLQNEAHAWVEAWDSKTETWVSLDPTPALPFTPGWGLRQVEQEIRSLYWQVDSWWHRWILGYGSGSRAELFELWKRRFTSGGLGILKRLKSDWPFTLGWVVLSLLAFSQRPRVRQIFLRLLFRPIFGKEWYRRRMVLELDARHASRLPDYESFRYRDWLRLSDEAFEEALEDFRTKLRS
jgi:transglutaminase-like putative cysteine protease